MTLSHCEGVNAPSGEKGGFAIKPLKHSQCIHDNAEEDSLVRVFQLHLMCHLEAVYQSFQFKNSSEGMCWLWNIITKCAHQEIMTFILKYSPVDFLQGAS